MIDDIKGMLNINIKIILLYIAPFKLKCTRLECTDPEYQMYYIIMYRLYFTNIYKPEHHSRIYTLTQKLHLIAHNKPVADV